MTGGGPNCRRAMRVISRLICNGVSRVWVSPRLARKSQCVVRQTRYQKLELYETEEFGKLLALDGKVMLTERDERFYHEMLVHPAMLTHPNPARGSDHRRRRRRGCSRGAAASVR